MCLAGSVGRGGANALDDVRTVQLLLQGTPEGSLLKADGKCGDSTIAAVEAYQATLTGNTDPPGQVRPEHAAAGSGTTTLRALRSTLSDVLTDRTLHCIYIHAPAAAIARFLAPLLAGMHTADVSTPLRQSHFLAQVGHECGELRYTQEIASGAAYEGRRDLGNTEPGDGERFKGRGLIQLTGRANYIAYGKARNADFISGGNPERIATEPSLAVDAAVWFWQTHRLNALADADDVVALTKRINGGTNGLADRERLLARARWFLDRSPVAQILPRVQAAAAALRSRRERSRRKHRHRAHRSRRS